MDDILLFTPSKKSHIGKLEDLLKVLLKMDLKSPQRNISSLGRIYNIWATQSLLRKGEFASSQ